MGVLQETFAPDTTQTQTDADYLDPWLQDGNIVLAVERKYFRVHRSVLSSYSEVFKNMFECCKEPSSEEFIEQCPVVHLHGDTATDVQTMLKSMYERSYPFLYHEKMSLPIVATFLRLGEKYAIQRFHDEVKARLSLSADFSLLQVAADHPWEFLCSGSLLLFPRITGDPHNFQMMNLLREMDLRSALPLAMYQCIIACPVKSVVDGYKFNGTVCNLSPANLQSYIHVKDIIDSFRIQLAQSLRVSHKCAAKWSCVCNVCRLWSDETVIKHPFDSWRQEWDVLFCTACRTDLNQRRNAAIEQAWAQIPTAFGFKSWVEVATFKC